MHVHHVRTHVCLPPAGRLSDSLASVCSTDLSLPFSFFLTPLLRFGAGSLAYSELSTFHSHTLCQLITCFHSSPSLPRHYHLPPAFIRLTFAPPVSHNSPGPLLLYEFNFTIPKRHDPVPQGRSSSILLLSAPRGLS